MTGSVDQDGRALIELCLQTSSSGESASLVAWIDTAFTGDLVIPHSHNQRLGLVKSAAVLASLADGTAVVLETFSCILEWFGEHKTIEVIENDGQFPLLGTSLLQGRRLEIDFRQRTVVMD